MLSRILEYHVESLECSLQNHAIPEVPLEQSEILELLLRTKLMLSKENSALRLELTADAKCVVVGTLQGKLSSLVTILDRVGYPPSKKLLFLGNIIGNDHRSLALLCLVLILKLRHPDCVFILRGKEESGLLIRTNIALRQECFRKYNRSVFKAVWLIFHYLPFAAVISNKIFCVSGGLSPELTLIEHIENVQRPTECPNHGLKCDLIWSCHDSETAGWADMKTSLSSLSCARSYKFGGEMVSRFLIRNNYDLMCCAADGLSDRLPKGYAFSAWKQLVTVSSTPVLASQFKSDGVVLVIDDSLCCSFEVFAVFDSVVK